MHNNNNINICFSCDDNYAKYAGVAIASVLYNANIDDNLSIYILDGGLSEQHKKEIFSLKSIKDCNINFIQIDKDLFSDYSKIHTHSYITIATYYRLKLASLLPEIDKIIYFDCDMVINHSLSELFNINLDNYLIAGVLDINKSMLRKRNSYINAGMIVFNLTKMREENTEENFIKWTNKNINKIKLGDQTIINEVCKGKIKIVDDTWNVQSSNFTNRSNYTSDPFVVHFVSSKKPWHWASFSYHRDLYFKYLQMTPWKLNESEYKHWTKDNQIASLIRYFIYRPFFMLRPRFYKAILKTYICPLFDYKPIIKNNTFIVWEPCSQSHSEVVPGYVKYLIDLGYHVSVCVNPKRYDEGLFSRFKDNNISLNKLSRKQIKKFFKKDDLSNISGVLVTTVGKLCDEIHYDDCYKHFNKKTDKSKIFFVEHEAKYAIDAGTWRENLITLRNLNYKGAKSVVVNPHYFGKVNLTGKNKDIVNFITVGAIQGKKKNNELIINSVKILHEKGYRNFKVTVIGKGHLQSLPEELQPYFDIKGRLPFDKMYDELEKADFMLTSYNETNPKHIRYNTTGTSGNFQLVYGFLKPCIIIESFASINGFTEKNSILYKTDNDFVSAMERGINISEEEYASMQEDLKKYAKSLYETSKNNLKNLIITHRCSNDKIPDILCKNSKEIAKIPSEAILK